MSLNPRDRIRLAGNASSLCEPALTRALAEHVNASKDWYDLCLQFVRTRLSVAPAAPTAIAAWRMVAEADRHTWYNPPAGVPVFWGGGSSGAGHVALADGHGQIWSNDIRRHGKIDLVPIAEIHQSWGLPYLGWSETLNGKRVFIAR